MRLDLREIINVPGTGVTFNYEPDLSEAVFGSVNAVKLPSRAVGSIRNSAGVLLFCADVDAVLQCTCARCLKDFEYPIHLHIETKLSEAEQDDPDVFLLQGDYADIDEIIITDFVLNMDQRILCSEDCKGLCENCGADLNAGPCKCKTATDPRLAVLGQLLEND